MNFNPVKLAASVALCQLAGVIGSIFTVSSISSWYYLLAKPSFSPPNWLFGPVWFTLYTLMGISLYLVLEANVKNKLAGAKHFGLVFFAIQLVLNAIWSIIFFGVHEIFYALVVIVLMW
ncbi:MAG: TspO/MBR family protein, partial [Candidatus Woesearchaeota archaeon]|nr:TspO/MBR family protein [Candidatus Woesearchaeota archaeon]